MKETNRSQLAITRKERKGGGGRREGRLSVEERKLKLQALLLIAAINRNRENKNTDADEKKSQMMSRKDECVLKGREWNILIDDDK